MNCKNCNDVIPEKRLKFLIENKKGLTCVNCSTEEKVVGFPIIEAKDTRSIQIVSQQEAEKLFHVSKQGGVQLK